jgi:hypothetical protein
MGKLGKVLDPSTAAPLVRAYYKGDDGVTYTGAKFDTLARGGHRADAADEITYDDLVAVTLLGSEVPPEAALRLLGPDARAVSAQLRGLPRLQRLASVDVDELHDPDHPAQQLWSLLRVDLDKSTASKLMARKRPHLIPVWDPVIGRELGPVKGHWRRVHDIATDHAHTLAAIRREAGVASGVSLLRILDVTLWMRGTAAAKKKSKKAKSKKG